MSIKTQVFIQGKHRPVVTNLVLNNEELDFKTYSVVYSGEVIAKVLLVEHSNLMGYKGNIDFGDDFDPRTAENVGDHSAPVDNASTMHDCIARFVSTLVDSMVEDLTPAPVEPKGPEPTAIERINARRAAEAAETIDSHNDETAEDAETGGEGSGSGSPALPERTLGDNPIPVADVDTEAVMTGGSVAPAVPASVPASADSSGDDDEVNT